MKWIKIREYRNTATYKADGCSYSIEKRDLSSRDRIGNRHYSSKYEVVGKSRKVGFYYSNVYGRFDKLADAKAYAESLMQEV